MVPVFAYGPGADSFTGVQQNTELFNDFIRLLSLKKK
jgi:alkaline phosphatase